MRNTWREGGKILTEGNEGNEGINLSSFFGLVPPAAANWGKNFAPGYSLLVSVGPDWSRFWEKGSGAIGTNRECAGFGSGVIGSWGAETGPGKKPFVLSSVKECEQTV